MDEWMQVHQLNGAYLIGRDARWLGITLPLTPFTGQHLREQASEHPSQWTRDREHICSLRPGDHFLSCKEEEEEAKK